MCVTKLELTETAETFTGLIYLRFFKCQLNLTENQVRIFSLSIMAVKYLEDKILDKLSGTCFAD